MRALRPLALAALVLVARPLASAPAPEPAPETRGVLGTYVRGAGRWAAGTPAALRVATHWAASERESGPWGGVEVAIALAGAGRHAILWQGRTDAAGLADARFATPSWPDGRYTLTIDARAGGRHERHTQEVAIAPAGKVLLQSDKPLYQPAQTIHLRAIALRPQDGRPVAGREIAFSIEDPRGNEVFRQTQRLSEHGVASADFALADEIALGAYRARAEVKGDQAPPAGELTLSVERYTLPRFKIALDTDRPWYAAGDRVKVSVDARYFFGKPVNGGELALEASGRGREGGARTQTETQTVTARLDQDGRARVEVAAPALPEGTLTLRARVTDTAQRQEQAARELPLSGEGARLDITPEAVAVPAGIDARVWVLAATPDGAPLRDVVVELKAGATTHSARTDAIGVATFTVATSRPPSGTCAGVDLAASLHQGGAVVRAGRCLGTLPAGTLAVRTDRAIYPPGAPLQVTVLGAVSDGPAWLDVVKDGQIVDVQVVDLRGGHGQITLPPDERRFGTLALDAYRIGRDGRKTRASRLVYVARPAALRLEVRPDKQVYRPGEAGRLRLKVVDAATGAGARASVGLVMVDQALLALRAVAPGAARAYFTLAEEATRPQLAVKVKPGGYTVERLVEEGAVDALRDEAAQVLLAGAAPPWTGWEIDPWSQRATARDDQVQRLATAAGKWVYDHQAGERAPDGGWRFRRDLVARMVASGAVPASDARDPWGRPVETDAVLAASDLADYDSFAHDLVDRRMDQIYRALARAEGLAVDSSVPPSQGLAAAVLMQADLERLVPKAWLIDPWGRPLRVLERKRAVTVLGVRSRFLVTSLGPDGRAGTADDLLPAEERGMVRRAVARTRLDGGGSGLISLMGYGTGAGVEGAVRAHVSSPMAIGATSSAGPPVRQSFPETMLWRPEVLTDAAGEASVDVTMADSITTWRLGAEAIAADGRLGAATLDVRVFQDFFVDLDLPAQVTQNDELSVPVVVYNYLPGPQRVTLELAEAAWFERAGEARQTQTIDLAPAQVGVRHFPIRVRGVGRGKLLVRATGASAADAVEKALEIVPDGVEHDVSFQDRIAPGRASHEVTVAEDAIAGASSAELKIYPSLASHVVEGLDSMLRMPGGCFEQTSSTTYPNALVLDYLRRTGTATPAVERKARAYLAAGYQRLLGFEVRGGGFSWFGDAPANVILTAYGLEEFHDMARVHPVDGRVITRTQAWLAGKQQRDGSWRLQEAAFNEGATQRFQEDRVRNAAYIALALRRSGYAGPEVARAQRYVRGHLGAERDPYTLALAAELLGDPLLQERLWRARADQPGGRATAFVSGGKTPTYGDGKAGAIETTARAAHALLGGKSLGRADAAIAYLLQGKDTSGSWFSTQATILALKALLAYGEAQTSRGKGSLTVTVDGVEVASVPVDLASEAVAAIELRPLTQPGRHTVALAWQGTGALAYQLVSRTWRPRGAAPPPGDLSVATTLDRDRVKAGEAVTMTVSWAAQGHVVEMPIVTAGVPPGFDVDPAALERLVSSGTVAKVQRTPRELIFYLTRLVPGRPQAVQLELRPRFPARVQVPAPTLYEYYRPEHRATGAPVLVTVSG